MLFLSLTLSLKSPEDGMEWARLPQKQSQSTRHTLVPSPLELVRLWTVMLLPRSYLPDPKASLTGMCDMAPCRAQTRLLEQSLRPERKRRRKDERNTDSPRSLSLPTEASL